MLRTGNQARGTDAHPPRAARQLRTRREATRPRAGGRHGKRAGRRRRSPSRTPGPEAVGPRQVAAPVPPAPAGSASAPVALLVFTVSIIFIPQILIVTLDINQTLIVTILSIVNSSLNYSLIHSFIPFHPFTETQIQMPHFIFFASRRLCPQN